MQNWRLGITYFRKLKLSHYSIPSKEPEAKLECEAQYNDKYAKCVADCGNNAECISSCNRDYDQSVSDCPCNANCPNGCPCLNYDCDQNKPKTSVLVLNTFSSTNPALITNANGTTDTNFWFKMDSEVYDSCSISYQGQFYLFGGYRGDKKQISTIKNCNLQRVGELPFEFDFGTCTTTGSSIFMCFNRGTDYKSCKARSFY